MTHNLLSKPTNTTFADETIHRDTTSTCKQDIQYVSCTMAVMVHSWLCSKLIELYRKKLTPRQQYLQLQEKKSATYSLASGEKAKWLLVGLLVPRRAVASTVNTVHTNNNLFPHGCVALM